MATWIIGGALALVVALIIWKMLRDKRAGKSACNCGCDCQNCTHSCGKD